MRKYFQKYWPSLFLLVVFLMLFYKVFFFGQVFYDGDNFHLNIPEKYFFVEQVLHGHVPLWNPYLFTGIPSFADMNLGTLNPTNILYFLFPVPRALTLLTILDFFALAAGMYLLLRSYLLTKTSSVFGAVVMSLSGMPFVLLGNMTMLQVIVYIPFLFLFAQKICKEKRWIWVLVLVCIQFLQLIAGHPQETYYTMVFVAFYLLVFLPVQLWKRLFIVILYGVFPLLLSSVQLLPFLEYVQHANRPVGNILYAGWGGISLSLLPTFLFPTFYGSHLDGTWWGPQQILVGFIGIPTLIFLYVGIRRGKILGKWFYVVGLVGSFLLAFGKLTPLFYFAYYLIPGWRLFRAPAGILVFYTFFAAILASFGLEYIQKNSEKFRKLGKIFFWLGVVSTIVAGVAYVFASTSGFWQKTLLFLSHHFHTHVLQALLFYDAHKLQVIFQGIVWNVVFVSTWVLFSGSIFWFFANKRYQSFLFLLLIVVGFLLVDSKAILLAPLSFYDTGKTIPSLLQPVVKGKYRILSLPVDFHQQRQHLAPVDFFFQEGQANLAIYQYDNNIERRLYQAGGYVSLVPASFATFIGAKDATSNVTNINFSGVSQKQLNLASVRYIISHERIQTYNAILFRLVTAKPGMYYIYENVTALPRAYVLENPTTNITWKTVEPTTVSFLVPAQDSSRLILTDWQYPGWKAFVNGREVQITSYLSTFQQISIPKGNSTVQFIYDPLSLKIGILISAISFGILGVLLLFLKKKSL